MKRFDPPKTRGVSLKMKLFWLFAAFFLFAILLLWVLQVVLMDSFYQSVTEHKMNNASDGIVWAVRNGEDVSAAAYRAADNSGACVSVYMIKDGSGMKIADAHIKNGCYVHDLVSSHDLGRIYSETVEAGGHMVKNSGEDTEIYGAIFSSNIVEDKGVAYMILLSTDPFPAGAMATTVTLQLSIITVILIIGAGILAILLSRKITRPVSQLCFEAERLAEGDYKIDFSEGTVSEINRLGETLQYAAAELERSDIMQKELIANITHDLRTPLTMISGYSEIMRDIPGEVTPENLQVIIDESARLSALVNDVLEVSKAQSGSAVLKLSEFCISDSVRRTVERYGVMLSGKGYSIQYESDCDGVFVIADETKIIQALCNLVNNAVNFTGEDKCVKVRLLVNGGICRIEVTDTGKGIPPEELENIWDRYYRARDFQNKGIAGSGLGLSIVRHIMMLHDASFGVISAKEKGSTFWFELKIKE